MRKQNPVDAEGQGCGVARGCLVRKGGMSGHSGGTAHLKGGGGWAEQDAGKVCLTSLTGSSCIRKPSPQPVIPNMAFFPNPFVSFVNHSAFSISLPDLGK